MRVTEIIDFFHNRSAGIKAMSRMVSNGFLILLEIYPKFSTFWHHNRRLIVFLLSDEIASNLSSIPENGQKGSVMLLNY